MAGSPDRRAAEAAIHSPFQLEGETQKLWKGETGRETAVSVGPSGGREAPACGEAAGSVARMSVTRGDAYGLGPTRADIPRGSKQDPGDRAKAAGF